MTKEYATYDIAAITQEAYRMRDRAIAHAFVCFWRGSKKLVVSAGEQAVALAHKAAAQMGQRAPRHH